MNARQPAEYLKKADEIIVEARDYRIVPELFVKYPEAMINLDTRDIEATMEDILSYAEASENFCCIIYNFNDLYWYKDNHIKFYYGYNAESFYDLKALAVLGVEYVKIQAPITFSVDKLKSAYPDVKFRMSPNISYAAYIPRENGMFGQYVRPEDVGYYEDAIYVMDFEDADLAKEQTLYKVYAVNKNWPGNLNLLITNLNINADNRGLPDEFGEIRANCGQKCMSGSKCRFCQTAFTFESTLRRIKKERNENQKLDNN